LTSTLQLETLSSVTSLLTATYYRGNHDRKNKFWNNAYTER
jgi:hypothetical protein